MRIHSSFRAGLLALVALAAPFGKAVANSVTLNTTDGYQSGIGGEFTAVSLDSILNPTSLGYSSQAIVNGGFETFCVEFTEEFTAGTPYQYGISGTAISGGGPSGGATLVGGVWQDPISVGTAWLYRQFATGVLSGYDYTAGTSRENSAAALQQAFWYLEGEQSDPGAGAAYISLAESTLGLNLAGIEMDANGLYGVSVLNMGNIADNPEFQQQDQLVLTPGFQASLGSVPEGGATISLLGAALVCLGMLRRKNRHER